MTPQEDIVSLVSELVSSLVENQDAIELDPVEQDGELIINVKVAADEMGKVIGRQGRIIKAIRTIARAAGSKTGISVEVEVLD